MDNRNISISIIIPLFNEENSIVSTINDVKTELEKHHVSYEILAINDGSNDNSKKILEDISNIKIISHPYNKGYGASLKTGIKNAKYNWVLFFDADGQHRAVDIIKFIKHTDKYSLVAGDRSQSKYTRPLIRKPGLWILQKIANYLVDYKIPDLNCGFRLIKKDAIKQYLHLMPSGFSFSTTSTLAFLKDKRNVKFLPIEINQRDNSRSMVRPKDALSTFILILKIIMLFSPLRIFFPLSLILAIIGTSFLLYDLTAWTVSNTAIFILLTSLLIFIFGLLADQVAALRREINTYEKS
ncbi:MAG: glycosyltransferase family 2 protein [Patescibacteria group bacterium]|nr:glycosyltransferase family 2 protein [Patescibacteria group bacterium]